MLEVVLGVGFLSPPPIPCTHLKIQSAIFVLQEKPIFGTEVGEGDATKQKSVKRSAFSLNEGKAFRESSRQQHRNSGNSEATTLRRKFEK